MRRLMASIVVAIVIAVGAVTASFGAAPTATVAKTCGDGYTHAVIGGVQKCLRRGEFCSYWLRNQYHRYGFNCVSLEPSETYHLEPRG